MKYLDEIEARANAATEGPWEVEHHYNRLNGNHVVSEIPRVAECEGNGDGGLYHAEDAEFVSCARETVPALVVALRAVLEMHAPTPSDIYPHDVCHHPHCTDPTDQMEQSPWPCPTVETIRQHLGEEA